VQETVSATAIPEAMAGLQRKKHDERRVFVPVEEGGCCDKNVGWISMRALAARRWRVDGGTAIKN
jgi:hypothetical protein